MSEQVDESCYEDEQDHHLTCPGCGKPYTVTIEVPVAYSILSPQRKGRASMISINDIDPQKLWVSASGRRIDTVQPDT
ncbi:hypothetical protein [Modicisalibacter sp. MOD 31.J]|uniref:hypothetical protein n=1 Tax=Modicisalibacter sp. MOD 31.J TaxID=2831897 RepID=UPI001CCC6236|nr:hypothetical protein [Modicisalibacter sp. MOD 31.J]MBZ9574561.1 hypothetical protein [Modicisalibacter sp. MOD 31.J]